MHVPKRLVLLNIPDATSVTTDYLSSGTEFCLALFHYDSCQPKLYSVLTTLPRLDI